MTAPDFGPLAARYDRLRPVDDNWQAILDVLWEEGDLVGRRVLDAGCGTGRLAAAFAERGAKVWGVDPSVEMLEEARARAPRGVGFKLGSAESLPFRDGWFERAVLHLVVHLVDRTRALPELLRVLCPGGRVVVATFRPEHFEGIWLARLFPSLASIDRARFPEPEALCEELGAAGFRAMRVRDVHHEARVSRDEALEKLRGRFISTLWLLDEQEYRDGLVRAERELDAEIAYPREWAIVTAER